MTSKSPSSLPLSLHTALSRSDAFFTRLALLLSAPRSADVLLMTITYTLRLLSSLTSTLTTAHLNAAAVSLMKHLSITAPTALLPGETLIATITPSPDSRLLRFQASASVMAKAMDEYRTFSRLWGLLGIWAWAKGSWREPPQDWVLRWIRWMQVVCGVTFQGSENIAWLGSRGVVRLREGAARRWYLWSARAWMGHVGLEFVRLGRELTLMRRRGKALGETSREEKREEAEELLEDQKEVVLQQRRLEEAKWWRDLCVDAAWMPVTVHYSLEDGFLGPGAVAALGLIPSITALREMWKGSA